MIHRYPNRTTYNRSEAGHNHYKKSIDLDIYKNQQLNFTDIGLLTWLLSNDDSYVINKGTVMTRSGLPENKFLSSWKKLQELGYIVKIPFKGGVEWQINEVSTIISIF